MAGTYVGLKEFKPDELIFDEQETKDILTYLFKGYVAESQIQSMQVTDAVRGFAQGLLVEAIDASYALGYVEALFRATANPTAGVKSIIKKFGKKALKHWFKHASGRDLQDIKIYDRVRERLAENFQTPMRMMIDGVSMAGKKYFAMIKYADKTARA